jgi:hypothetical protein
MHGAICRLLRPELDTKNPAVPFQQNRWMPEARLALCLQFHIRLRHHKIALKDRLELPSHRWRLSETETSGCDGYHMRTGFFG